MQYIGYSRVGFLLGKRQLLITYYDIVEEKYWALPAIYISQVFLTKNVGAKTKIQLKDFLNNIIRSAFFCHSDK